MRSFILLIFYICSVQSIYAREAIWIEGEDASSHTFNNHRWYSERDLALDLLSPGVVGVQSGGWLSHFDNDGSGGSVEAAYVFELSEEGPHTIWVRINDFSPVNTYQIDEDEVRPLPRDQNHEEINLHINRAATSGGWIDIRFLDWIYLGEFDLAPGQHTLTIHCNPGDQSNGNFQAHIGVDAVTIVNFPWGPTGGVRPTAEPLPEPAPDDWFPFHHAIIKDGESEVDRSDLVEAPTGQHGAVTRVGANYQFEDGTPIKFWGVGASVPANIESMEKQAKFFRRMGINLVRLHTVSGILGPLKTVEGSNEPSFDPDRLDRLDRYVSILRAHGIYMQWSVFWKEVITEADGYPQDLYNDLGDDRTGKSTYGVINISRELQDIRWRSLNTLLNHVNPHTGTKYADEPTLAILEIQNEDTIFFHSPLTGLRNEENWPLHSAMFRRQWAEWVKTRYPTDDALATAWGAGKRAADSVNAEELGIYGAWEMSANGPSQNIDERARMGDFIRFCAELQREYWLRRREEIRNVGFKGVVLSTAWKAGGPAGEPANMYTDSALETIDRHGYWGGFGDTHVSLSEFGNDSILDLSKWYNEEDGSWHTPFLSSFFQIEDLPFGMSEWTHGSPGQFRAEGGPIYAFYGMGLQGWDTSLHFAYGANTSVSTSWDFNPTYRIANPIQVGQYPALATAVHHGHLSEGQAAATRRFTPDQIFSGVDVFTQPGGATWEGEDNLFIPPQIFALGRVSNAVGDDVGPPERSDWSNGWNKDEQTVTANTGELYWNYGERYFEVKTDKTQGVVGFVGGKSFELPNVKISVETPFVSLLITSMDNRPIHESGKVLVTAVASEKWTGSEIEGVGVGARLNALGGPPLMMEPVQASLMFNEDFDSAEVLDSHGRRTGRLLEKNDENAYVIDGRFTTIYYLFERQVTQETGGTEPETGGSNDVNGGVDSDNIDGGADGSDDIGGVDQRGGHTRLPSTGGQAGGATDGEEMNSSDGCNTNSRHTSTPFLLFLLSLLFWRRCCQLSDGLIESEAKRQPKKQ